MDPLYVADHLSLFGMFIFLLVLSYLVVTDVGYVESLKEKTEEEKEREKTDEYIDKF